MMSPKGAGERHHGCVAFSSVLPVRPAAAWTCGAVGLHREPRARTRTAKPDFTNPLFPSGNKRKLPPRIRRIGIAGANSDSASARRRMRVASVPRMAGLDADPYEVLGIAPDADDTTIKKAYRRAALRSHPDVSREPNAKERFMKIQEAYAILSDPSKRAAYDRRKSGRGVGFEDFASGFSDFASSAASSASSAEAARRWRERNPMPEDLNDNFGSIFSDFVSGVSSAVGSGSSKGPGIFEDFVEFLEKNTGVPGTSSWDGYGSDDDGLDEILKSRNKDVLEAEIDDTSFLLDQLRARKAKLEKEANSVDARAAKWSARAERSPSQLESWAREEAKKQSFELKDESRRLRTRISKVETQIAAQEYRLQRLRGAIEDLKSPQPKSTGTSSTRRTYATREQDIDDELQRLKKEMGL